MNVPLSCACGTVTGQLADASATSVTRIVCYCEDCQTYAHHLGRSDSVLDPHGGTDITQVDPAALTFTRGFERIKGVRQSPNGALRVYTECCRTPIANLAGDPKKPWIGLVHAFVDHSDAPRDELFGPPLARVRARDANGDVSALAAVHNTVPRSLLFVIAPKMMKLRLFGGWKKTPFFDRNRKPLMPFTVMSKEAREALQKTVRAQRS